jgi:hypothetical protein
MTEALVALGLGLLASFAGGVLGGLLIGGKALGAQLASLMGFFFGPTGGFLGVALGLLISRLLGQGG